MRRCLAAGVLCVAGCSVLYNPDQIGTGDAARAIDAAVHPDAEVILDGDPTMLRLVSVAPSAIYEGQGDGSSRAALVVISGFDIGSDASVAITAGSGSA